MNNLLNTHEYIKGVSNEWDYNKYDLLYIIITNQVSKCCSCVDRYRRSGNVIFLLGIILLFLSTMIFNNYIVMSIGFSITYLLVLKYRRVVKLENITNDYIDILGTQLNRMSIEKLEKLEE